MGLSDAWDPKHLETQFVLSAHPVQATFSAPYSYAKISYKGKKLTERK